MFTGIIETLGVVKNLEKEGSNLHLTIESSISNELKIDQSVAHNGICLTVVGLDNNTHTVTAVDETMKKTNLKQVAVGHELNLERCMPANGRFDGHVVQGHVDQVAICTKREELDGSWLFDFEYDAALNNITVEKGSITINGTSLTCFNSGDNSFSVTIIPFTIEHTNFKHIQIGDEVNLEFDIIGKYVSKLLNKR
ncbi:MAG: riboflavin synthase [Reichenbachiella sp.]